MTGHVARRTTWLVVDPNSVRSTNPNPHTDHNHIGSPIGGHSKDLLIPLTEDDRFVNATTGRVGGEGIDKRFDTIDTCQGAAYRAASQSMTTSGRDFAGVCRTVSTGHVARRMI